MLHVQSSHLSRPSPTKSCTVADLQLPRPSSRKGQGDVLPGNGEGNFEGVDLLFVQIKKRHIFGIRFFFSVFFFLGGGESRRIFLRRLMDADDSGSRYGFRIRCAQGCVHSGKSLQKKSGRLPCSEQWWPFSWCWAAQGFSDPKRGPRMDPFRHLSGWNCDWRTQVAVTVPSWKVAIARLAADTSNCGKTG